MLKTVVLLSALSAQDMECLAKNVYHEARSEPIVGQFAVAHVTINRVMDKRYPNTICDVVYQTAYHKKIKKKVCQFSWYCDGLPDSIYERQTYKQIKNALRQLPHVKDPTNGATHYHHKKISPYWAPTLRYNATIGKHKFYKWN